MLRRRRWTLYRWFAKAVHTILTMRLHAAPEAEADWREQGMVNLYADAMRAWCDLGEHIRLIEFYERHDVHPEHWIELLVQAQMDCVTLAVDAMLLADKLKGATLHECSLVPTDPNRSLRPLVNTPEDI